MFDFKKFRKAKQLTQQDMAGILGLSQVSYSRIETGNWTPSEEKTNSYIQSIKKKYPDLIMDDYAYKTEKTGRLASIHQKNVLGLNYIGKLERQNEEDRSNFQEILDTLKSEVAKKNEQIETLQRIIEKQNEIIINISKK